MKKLIIISTVILFLSCSEDTELSNSIHIPDQQNPDLPAYTEWGYNTFGAYYNRGVFKYSYNEIPLIVTAQNEKVLFIFQGMLNSASYDYLALKFHIPDYIVNNYQDLLIFDDLIINLTGEDILVERITELNSAFIDVIEGELHFKRAQRLFVDDVEQGIILSGYFDLTFIENEIPSKVSDGRFDCGVNDNNFYYFE